MPDCIYPHGDDRPAHAPHVGYLCRSGFDRLEQTIAEMHALSGWLHANLAAGGSGKHDEAKRTKGEPPIPIRETIHDHVTEIRAVLASWCQLVAEERELTGPANADPATTTTFLLAHLSWAAQQPWVDDFANEVGDLARVGHGLAPSRPGRHRLPIPCPDCASDLMRLDGDDYVQCENCQRLWTEADYAFLVFRLIGEADLPEWSPVSVVADRFGLNPATVWKWKQRGLLQAKKDSGQVLVRLVCDVTATEGAA